MIQPNMAMHKKQALVGMEPGEFRSPWPQDRDQYQNPEISKDSITLFCSYIGFIELVGQVRGLVHTTYLSLKASAVAVALTIDSRIGRLYRRRCLLPVRFGGNYLHR